MGMRDPYFPIPGDRLIRVCRSCEQVFVVANPNSKQVLCRRGCQRRPPFYPFGSPWAIDRGDGEEETLPRCGDEG